MHIDALQLFFCTLKITYGKELKSMPQKSNWDILRNQKDSESIAHRDVYADQQLKRGNIKKAQTMTSRTIFTVLISILIALAVYFVFGIFDYISASINGVVQNTANQTQIAKIAKNPLMLDKNTDASMPQTVQIKYYKPKGYYITNMDGGQLTKCTKNLNKVPIKGYWNVENAKDYGFKHIARQGDGSIRTIKQIKIDKGTAKSKRQQTQQQRHGFVYYVLMPTFTKVLFSLAAGVASFLIIYELFKRNLKSQNLLSDTTDINQYHGDQHVMLPEELMEKFEPFPDAGAHSYVQPSSLISHTAMKNKGIKDVYVTKRYAKDTYDSKTKALLGYKGAAMYDNDGYLMKEKKPMFDTKFMDELFTASEDPRDDNIRISYDANKIKYKPENVGDMKHWKKAGVKTVADLINADWEMPDYEVQRPAGVYWVDTAPVNTMVLAITRAGKGQTYIEPLIDMWTREKRPNNMVINDPKGELLQEFYVPGTYRGFQIVQFNLINSMNTDIYNPLILAAQAAQEGDFTKCSMYIENIGKTFFPLKGSDDPVWPNAANNAFKRTAFGLIDYYLEEEKELRIKARAENMDQLTLDREIDHMWGHVTLYNCYQMFVRLTSKKIPNPLNKYNMDIKSGAMDKQINEAFAKKGITQETDPEFKQKKMDYANKLREEAVKKSELWGSAPEIDEMSLYFNATDKLPVNSMRELVSNANHSLTAMAGADKMLASCDLFAC